MGQSNRTTADASTPEAAQQKVNEQTQRLLELIDSCDAEDRLELDVSQIGKDIPRDHH